MDVWSGRRGSWRRKEEDAKKGSTTHPEKGRGRVDGGKKAFLFLPSFPPLFLKKAPFYSSSSCTLDR